MDVFALRDNLINDYSAYVTSFMKIREERVKAHVSNALDAGKLWPNPQIGLNPAFQSGGSIDQLVADGTLAEANSSIFRAGKSIADKGGKPLVLHQHQVDAIRSANDDKNYVLTTGTGSGKSLSYIVPIVDHVLRTGTGQGVKAIVVYPMNALANSQLEELGKFIHHGPWGANAPVSFARYTGQEDNETRQRILDNPPDILLTNYVMLELILTRVRDRKLVDKLGDLRFLVLDELHTYRGRQGADVALLVRRLREASQAKNLLCVGTSATLSTEGSRENQLKKVAGVASLLFGSEVEPAHVIGETLRRSTVELDLDDPSFVEALKQRVASRELPSSDPVEFCADPLSAWVESTFGIVQEEERLVRVVPLAIEGSAGGAEALALVTGADISVCAKAIKQQLMTGYEVRHPETGFPVFAFRLHQFISKGDTVYATPEAPKDRYLNLTPQRFVPKDRNRLLLPLAFCRSCGQDYYVVSQSTEDGDNLLVTRDIGDQKGEAGREAGFLYLSDDLPWPTSDEEVAAKLPDEWYEWTKAGTRKVRQSRKKDIPRPLVVHPNGLLEPSSGVVPAGATLGWWITTPFKFCLACGVSHDTRGRDFGRLSTLGSEGRSTATTILSLSAVEHLRLDDTLDKEAQKVLSFTDNRQDASLQAGHFNDFVQVTQLRGALWKAVSDAGPEGLGYDEIAHKVFETLNLPFEEYSNDPDLVFGARNDTNRVFRDILLYRIYLDLRRGWRVNQPNLEQCGLLRVDYDSLDEVAAADELWQDCHEAIADASPELRSEIATVLLDYLRRDLVIKVDSLDQDFQDRIRARSSQRINDGPWDVSDEKFEYSSSVVARSRQPGDNREWTYVSARGSFGRYLRRGGVLESDGKLTLVECDEIIEQLFERLRRAGLLELTVHEATGTNLYQVQAASLRWVAGDGASPYQDQLRMPNAPSTGLEANNYFVDAYRAVGEQMRGIRAAEHTAQVRYQDRLDREEAFRSAQLPVLYCSPTMELGVDISQLNVVSMRNVPPTPANYAQRSGRAGRSGQPALVFTYCSVGSSHDQYFFERPEKLVAGQVEAPRIELGNEDLIRAHVQAIWLAESGLDLKSSMREVLDLSDDNENPTIHESVAAHLVSPDYQVRAGARAQEALADLLPHLATTPWWDDDWIGRVIKQVPTQFETALIRWRTLYRAALQQAREQSNVARAADRSRADKNNAKRLRNEAERQLDLLRAESDGRGQSDFYTYRYFAAEGFLPGYSFPRLPLSAYIPGRRGRFDNPEYLQRPRFLAISEFGPQSLIYHEGERFRINRVILPVGDLESDSGGLSTQQAQWCDACGYLHPIAEPPGRDVCEFCTATLPHPMTNLFRLQNVATQRRDRITSDEEERQRQGYELKSGVHFATRHGKPSFSRAEVVDAEGETFAELAYGDTATIWRVNLGWRRRKEQHVHGFVLDLERGYWEKSEDALAEDENDAESSKRTARVIPYVEDTRNALLFTPSEDLGADEMATLMAALKVALQITFQLEGDEIAAEPLPSVTDRKVLLVYESAEGGAGVLKRLVDEPGLLAEVASEAIRQCHIDPVTGAELPAKGEDHACEAACYGCLMSYRNQMDHMRLDRSLVLPYLRRLQTATTRPATHAVAELEAHVESSLEAAFIAYLKDGNFRLPDRQHVYFEGQNTNPDYVYDDACAAIYVDGPYHDYPDRQKRDAAADEAMRDQGYKVIRFGHRDDWAQIIDTFKSVFGAGTP